ncbi:methyl-accepting chemotaxis protein [Alicyclobacillus sendaiensis]|uniref:methyl-accepting chemotaxis protein n=1 Tax=Alicyclobacillus sendaiensis TaxID=192387 RepID=UPI0009FB6F0C|nr:methyl-accepting chemotaxis protein [Alicyclobacillus sendaiensis]
MKKLRLHFFSSLKVKLLAMTLSLLVLPSLIIGLSGYIITAHQLSQAGKIQLKQDVLHVIALINEANKQVKSGKLSIASAQEMVKEEVLGPKEANGHRPINPGFKIGRYGYIFAINDRAVELMHPTLEGKDIWDLKSIDGKMVGQELVRLADKGGGYLTYMWPYPNSNRVGEKIVYVQKDPSWGWDIVAGSYMVDFNAQANQVLKMLSVTLGLAIIVGTIVCLWFVHRISKPISMIAQQVDRMSQGDLRVERVVKRGNDEVSRLARGFSLMANRLHGLINDIYNSSQQLAASAEELAASAEESSKAAEVVAQTAEEVAATAEKQVRTAESNFSTISDMVHAMQQVADNAQVVSTSASEAAALSKYGRESIGYVREGMDSIRSAFNSLAMLVKGLGERSDEIGQIVDMISGVADQTNLLALNAAIEAARAGDNGRSFAVVAVEIRKLADRSAQSAKHIAELIKSIQEETNAAVKTMGESTQGVVVGIERVNQAVESFEKIERAVNVVAEQIEEVSAAAQQLSAEAEELRKTTHLVVEVTESTSRGMQNISAATQQQLASAEEITSSAQSLGELAEHLQSLVGQFKL